MLRSFFRKKFFNKMVANFSIPVKELVVAKRKLISIPSNATVISTLDTLTHENLTSAPVFGAPGHWISSGGFPLVIGDMQIIGIINLADLLIYSLKGLTDERIKKSVTEALGSTNESLSLWVERSTQPLSNVLERLSKGVHHCLVQDADDSETPLKILSQTDVVSYFFKHILDFPIIQSVFNRPAGAFASTNVQAISLYSTMFTALHMLTKVKAVPVLDRDGELITSLSLSDLRGNYKLLFDGGTEMTVYEFLQTINNGRLFPAVYISSNEPLRVAINMMLEHKIHRVWIRQTPSLYRDAIAGVLTMTDVLHAVYEEDRKEISASMQKVQKEPITRTGDEPKVEKPASSYTGDQVPSMSSNM